MVSKCVFTFFHFSFTHPKHAESMYTIEGECENDYPRVFFFDYKERKKKESI